MLLWRERVGWFSVPVQAADVTHMNGFGVMAFHAVSNEVFGEQRLDAAVEPYHVVIARMLPASSTLADGITMVGTNGRSSEVDASDGGGAVEDDFGDGAHNNGPTLSLPHREGT